MMHRKVLQRPGGETLTNFLSKETLSTTVAVFGASHEAALTHINQIKAFPLERFFANLSNKYVGLFFFEKKKIDNLWRNIYKRSKNYPTSR